MATLAEVLAAGDCVLSELTRFCFQPAQTNHRHSNICITEMPIYFKPFRQTSFLVALEIVAVVVQGYQINLLGARPQGWE